MLRVMMLGIAAALITVYLGGSVALLPAVAVKVGDNPVTTSPADVGLDFDAITVESDGLALEGWWMPAAQPRANLLFVHGAGSNRTSWFIKSLELYKALVDSGISVITVDLRNHGNSPKTDGTLDMGAEEWRDVIAMADWLDANIQDDLPRIVMGASMGGAASIYALHNGLEVDRAILFDPALNTADSMAMGAWIETGFPPMVFALYAWSATHLHGLPSGEDDAGAIAQSLELPILLLQDPDDPITRLPFAEALAQANSQVRLAVAPTVADNAACLKDKGRWGTHVAAFSCHREWTVGQLSDFLADL